MSTRPFLSDIFAYHISQVEIWDYDLFSSNDFIGSLTLDLHHLTTPQPTSDKCDVTMTSSGGHHTVDLFELKNIRGWWLVTGEDEDGKIQQKVVLPSYIL